AAKAAAAAAA
nr:Chain D, UNK-UNK-K-UNK-UNK-UNK-UNK-UNK-UNK-UNK [Helicobacter pylori 26695]